VSLQRGKVYDASRLPRGLTIEVDLCVIGSGAGGMTAAMVAAETGIDVLVLEAGELLGPPQMTQREEQMFPKLLWDNGNRTTRDLAVKIHQGRGVGGSTLHNLNLCKRIPAPILRRRLPCPGASASGRKRRRAFAPRHRRHPRARGGSG